MELRHLEYFVTVAEELHFARAAERLHIAQQPLSSQIQRLEEELQVTLFHRTTRKVSLTEAGEVFLKEAQQTLNHARKAKEVARLAQRGEIGSVSVGYVNTSLYNVLPGIIRTFRERYPGIAIVMQELCSPELEEAVVEGQIQLGFLSTPVREPSLNRQALLSEPVMVVLPYGHPLSQHPTISLKTLAGEPLIQYARSQKRYTHDQIEAMCHRAGFSPRVVQEAASEQAVIGLVAAGLGISVVPASLTSLRTPEVVYRPLVEPSVNVEYSLVWRQSEPAIAVQRLVQVARERVVKDKETTAIENPL
jgi:DNA-binding transcriptional LysR family regulator